VLALGDLVAAAFVLGGDRLAGLFIDELLAQAIAGGLVDLPQGDALGTRAGRVERNWTGDQGQFEIAFPVGTHNQLLWFLGLRGCLPGQRCTVHSARGLRAIAALPRTGILIAAGRGAISSREGKEPRTTPGGAGDGAGDGGQARISRALPVEAIGDDGDGVALAVMVANEHRAGLEAAPWRAAVPRQPVQEPPAFPVKP